MNNALIPSHRAGIEFPGLVILSFKSTTSRELRDSIVLSERLELVGGVRIGESGLGIWAFWIPDDSAATNARALMHRLSSVPGIGNVSLAGLNGFK